MTDLDFIEQALALAGGIFLVFSILAAVLFLSTGKEMDRMSDYMSRTSPS